jgi:hypothetical protein
MPTQWTCTVFRLEHLIQRRKWKYPTFITKDKDLEGSDDDTLRYYPIFLREELRNGIKICSRSDIRTRNYQNKIQPLDLDSWRVPSYLHDTDMLYLVGKHCVCTSTDSPAQHVVRNVLSLMNCCWVMHVTPLGVAARTTLIDLSTWIYV